MDGRESKQDIMHRLRNSKVMSPVSLIDALEFRRRQYDLTQRDFAELLGITPTSYSEIITGRRRLPINATKRAYAIGVPANCLLGDYQDPCGERHLQTGETCNICGAINKNKGEA